MEKHLLCKIFLSVYKNIMAFNTDRNTQFDVENYDVLEEELENYLMRVMGFSVINKLRQYKAGTVREFKYFGEVSKYFENLVYNGKFSTFQDFIIWLKQYTDEFIQVFDSYEYVDKFVKAAKKSITNDETEAVIMQKDDRYTIMNVTDKNQDDTPNIMIEDIVELEDVLSDYVYAVKNSESYYSRPFYEMPDDAEEYLFEWTLKNATSIDLTNVAEFYKKYTDFINDDTFDYFKYKPKYIGQLFGDELYLLLKKSTVAYETPYYLSFMLKDNRIELPNIRMGIENKNGEKVAHILAIQTSQDIKSTEREKELAGVIKKLLHKSKYFREFNPSHLLSIAITLGFLNRYGIKKVIVPDYLPLRYQRFVLEGRKSEEELHNYQHRLTNKLFNTFFRLFENVEGVKLYNIPEAGTPMLFKLEDEIIFENEFLQHAYNIGYKSSMLENEKMITK